MSGPADVTVVMCTYDGESFVAEQLRSVLAQTRPPVEIVVADDGSTDRTLEIVTEIAAGSTVPIRISRNIERLGFADNFLGACRLAAGDLIAFCDQDDVWLSTKLETQVAALTRTGAAMCAHDVWEMHADGSPRPGARSRTERSERVITDRTGDPWGNYLGNTLVFQRDLLERIPAEDRGSDPFSLGAPLSHDRWLYFLASTFGGIVILPARLAHYRRHGCQLYGAEVHRTIRERLRDKRAEGRRQALVLEGIALDRVRLLERYVPAGAGRNRSVARWRSVARRFERGASVYGKWLPGRIVRVGVNAVHGDYVAVRHGGLGWGRLLQDGCVALFAGTDRGASDGSSEDA